MNQRANIILAIRGLCELFASRSEDRTTLDEIVRMSSDRARWKAAHDLFQRIRAKNLKMSKRNDARMEAQYGFEEVCAKTLYNLSGESAPFDPDSPYWIIPNAFTFARRVGIDDSEVIRIIAG